MSLDRTPKIKYTSDFLRVVHVNDFKITFSYFLLVRFSFSSHTLLTIVIVDFFLLSYTSDSVACFYIVMCVYIMEF